jgi:methionine-rich copper-binding protein CopC
MPGHTVILKVDGEDGEQNRTGDGLSIELSNLSRGLHTVEATVVDTQGHAVIQAGPVSFNVLRVAAGGR